MRDNPKSILYLLIAILVFGAFSCSGAAQESQPSRMSETPTSSATNSKVPSMSDTPQHLEPSAEPTRDSIYVSPEDIQNETEDYAEIPTLEEEMGSSSSTSTPESRREDQIPQVVQAKEDLARRLSIHPTEIKLHKFEAVTWPDSSLGCPKPGMAYLDVLTPGYLLILYAKGIAFEYHASRGEQVVYCSNPGDPIPGTPTDI